MDLSGKVILLVGGLDDLAASVALRLIQDGASLMFAGSDLDRGKSLVEQAEALGGQVSFASTNPVSESDAQSMVAETIMTFGTIDGLVTLTGNPADDISNDAEADEWQASVDVNLKSTWLAAKFTMPFLRKSNTAAMVCLMKQVRGLDDENPILGQVTHAALHGLCRSLAVDFGPSGIRVNGIEVGTIEDREFANTLAKEDNPAAAMAQIVSRIPLGRLGTAKEVAPAVSFLLSAQASWISGSVLHIDGGSHAAQS